MGWRWGLMDGVSFWMFVGVALHLSGLAPFHMNARHGISDIDIHYSIYWTIRAMEMEFDYRSPRQ